MISILVGDASYPHLAAAIPTRQAFGLVVASLSVLGMLCAAIASVVLCAATSGKRATAKFVVDLVLFNVALTGVLTEIGIRAVILFNGHPVVATDPKSSTETIERLNRSLETLKGARYENGLAFNSMGFPEREFTIPKPRGVFRIAALADSFGVMPMMPYEYNHLTQLEAELEGFAGDGAIGVVNLSSVGNGPAEYLAVLEEVGSQLNPDLVVLYFFPGNDFVPFGVEQAFASRRDRFATFRVLRRLRRTYRVNLAWDGPSDASEVGVAIPDYIRDWRLEQAFIPRDAFLRLEQRRSRFFDPTLSEIHFAGALRFIDSIAARARALTGRPLVMFVVPEEMQVNIALRRELEKRLDRELDIDRPARYLRNHLAHLRDELIMIDLLPRFQRAQRELERVYFLQETHWNVNGNRVGAEEAARQLRAIGGRLRVD